MRSRHVVTSAASAGTVPCIALRSRVARSGETAGADGWIRCNHGADSRPRAAANLPRCHVAASGSGLIA